MLKGKKKTIFGGVAALVLVLSLLFGIGNTDSSTAPETTTETTLIVTEQASTDKTANITEEASPSGDVTSESKSPDNTTQQNQKPQGVGSSGGVDISSVPAYSGRAYVALNNNVPTFSAEELTTKGYENYSPLDSLGRCGEAIASCGREIMPQDGEERGSISDVKPSGWIQAQYDFVSGKYLYNRCHLIGWQLSAENANNRNLITGTRYMNTEGMLPFENMIADYINETGNHVAYRVTPVFKGNNLVASGVQLEAYSVEDSGDGICFNVYVYNVQPGVTINYASGSSWATVEPETEETTVKVTQQITENQNSNNITYILNTNSKKFHLTTCSSAKKISEKNYDESNLSRDELIDRGYSPCGNCKP